MKSAPEIPKPRAGLVFAFISGAVSLLSFVVVLLVLSITLHESDFLSAVFDRWPLLASTASLLLLVSLILGFCAGEVIASPLKRALRDIEALRKLESRKITAVEALSELQSLSESCRKLSDEMKQRAQSKDNNLSDAAHALKAPLARMLLQMELLERRSGTANEIDKVRYDIEGMRDTIRKTLDLAGGGKPVDMKLKRIDPLPILKNVVKNNLPSASARNQSIGLKAPDHQTWIMADEAILANIFEELLFNAMRFSPDGAKLDVRIDEENGTLRLTVSNSGPSLADNELKRIFEPFFRGEAARTGAVPGSGLGLALVSRRCKEMGASINAENNQGGGLRVSLRFKAA